MRKRDVFLFLCLIFVVVCCLAGYVSAEAIVPDLSEVVGLERMSAPESAKVLLQKNGFVVVPRFYRQIFSPYIQEQLPAFVTTDSLYHTFHVIFEEQIKTLEEQFAEDIKIFTHAMLEETKSILKSRELNEEELAALKRNLSFFSVAAVLMDDAFTPEEKIKDTVLREANLINNASGVSVSPVFGYRIDYSQFKPRGFYTSSTILSRYFHCMSWYGNCAFRLVSESETQSAAFIARVLSKNNQARSIWRKMDNIYTDLLAKSDDLTPEEYIAVLNMIPPKKTYNWVQSFKAEAEKLRDPKINSMVILPLDMPRWRELTKGMRVFGKRHIIDSEIFMYLTDPEVPNRGFPSGIDFMAANSSTRAKELLEKQGATGIPGFREGFKKSEAALSSLKQEEETSHYVHFLRLLETLLEPPEEGRVFPFMKTKAYMDKNLSTSLGAWAAMRHAWQLMAKQSVTYMGMRRPLPGWVEPNLPFYERLSELIGNTIRILAPVENMDIDRLKRLERLVADIEKIADKQIKGLDLNEDERGLLGSYGPAIARLSYFEGNSYLSENALPWMSLIADVHTEHESKQCLQVGIGPAMPIYVVIPWEGELHLAVGGAYSYYEFRQNIADRLTDEEWQKMAAAGKMPPMPSWTNSFISGYDEKAILERLKKGERVEEASYVNAPQITEFLEKAIQPGGVFEHSENLPWAVEEYGKKAGEEAIPLLIDMLREGKVKEYKTVKVGEEYTGVWVDGAANGAARALSLIAGVDELSALNEILVGGETGRAWLVLGVISSIGGKPAENVLLDAYKTLDDADLRRMIVGLFGQKGSKDITPFLIESFNEGPKAAVLEALSFIWGGVPTGYFERERFPETLSDIQKESLRVKAEELVLENLLSKDERIARAAVKAAGHLELADAVPSIEKKLQEAPGRIYTLEAVRALGHIGTDDACRVLIKLSYSVDVSGKYWIIEALGELENPLAVPRLKELLAEKEETNANNLRVCDIAAITLSVFYPDGPEWPQQEAVYDRNDPQWEMNRKEQDKVIDDWGKYLKAEGVGPVERPGEEERAVKPGRTPGAMSAYEVIEGGDRFISRNFSDEGILILSRSYSRTTHKLHGEWKEYGPGGELLSTRWFVHGEEADKEAFLESEQERLEQERRIEEQYTEFDRKEGARIDSFVGDLARAWKRGDHEFSRALISRHLEKEPGWVPGVFARFGYLMAVDRDFEGALAEFKKAWDLIEREPEDNFRNPEFRRRLYLVIPTTIKFMESLMERGLLEKERLSSERVFPGTEFSLMYASARGYPVSPLRELTGGNGDE